MKPFQLAITLGLWVALIPANAARADSLLDTPKPITVSVSQVFVPPGFDTNDNVQVVLHGNIFGTCFNMIDPISHIDPVEMKVYVAARAYPTERRFCSEILIPFDQVVDLGTLPAGNYQVVQVAPAGSTNHVSSLAVANATTTTEDEMFAAVSRSFVDTSVNPPMIHVVGSIPSSCLYLQELRIHHRAPHIVEVLPILAMNPKLTCSPQSAPLDATAPLPAVEPGPWLLYTRSINGQSLSSVQPN